MSTNTTLTVAALARQVGLRPDPVRYYERVGLPAAPARSPAGYRVYDQTAAVRLRLIKGAQRAGLRLRQIAELLAVIDQGQCPCGHTQALLVRRLGEVDAELARLRVLRETLAGLLTQAPAASCPEDTAEGWWCVQAFTQEGGDDGGVPELRLPVR